MKWALAPSPTDIYEAVVPLAHSLAGKTGFDTLLSGVAESLSRIVRFDHLGLISHDPHEYGMQGYILNAAGNPVRARL